MLEIQNAIWRSDHGEVVMVLSKIEYGDGHDY
jgi:hypothetical protein